jgi:pectin methylesterase-like acyl-CoA thioesterase
VNGSISFHWVWEFYNTVDYIFGNTTIVFSNCTLHIHLQMASQGNIMTV